MLDITYVCRLCSVLPLDKKAFPLTTRSSLRKYSILSAAPLSLQDYTKSFSQPCACFLGLGASPGGLWKHSSAVPPAMPSPSENRNGRLASLVQIVMLKVTDSKLQLGFRLKVTHCFHLDWWHLVTKCIVIMCCVFWSYKINFFRKLKEYSFLIAFILKLQLLTSC